ncbi:MAG: hypothetical protein ACOC2W_01310 [bacterium]
MRLILVPQFPKELRYQEWWLYDFPEKLSYYFDEIKVLGKNSEFLKDGLIDFSKMYTTGEFSPPNIAMKFEFEQIQEYYNMELYNDDILLLLDISFPGFFPHVLYHKMPNKAFAFCHATSINNLDYFEKVSNVRDNSKADSERAIFKLFNTVFVSSEYHREKLVEEYFPFPEDIVALKALPNPPFVEKFEHNDNYDFDQRENKIVSVSRPSEQKVNLNIEKFVEKEFGTKILRPEATTWDQYYDFLRNSKIVLLTGKEDTYGYAIIDAYLSGCNVVAPNNFAYPELLGSFSNQLYEKEDLRTLTSIIKENIKTHRFHELNNEHYINNFYDYLAMYMLEG